MGIRGEPAQPADAAQGMVWQAIAKQMDEPGSESEWVSVDDFPGDHFAKHPWSLSGGGSTDLTTLIEAAPGKLSSRIKRIGFYGVMGADDAMTAEPHVFAVSGMEAEYTQRLVVGDKVRDWGIADGDLAFHPYDSNKDLVSMDAIPHHAARLWPYRTELGNRQTFTRGTYFSPNLRLAECASSASDLPKRPDPVVMLLAT